MMKTFTFNKLIRDRVHAKMLQHKAKVRLKPVDSNKMLLHYFKAKIVEEALEVQASENNTELVSEIADVIETIYGLANALAIDLADIEAVRLAKHLDRGGFEQHIVVDTVSIGQQHPMYAYLLAHSDKYPEVEDACTS